MLWWTLLQLKSGESWKRERAVKQLSSRKNTQVVEALIDVLQYDTSTRVRTAAAKALTDIGNPLAVAPLGEALFLAPSISPRDYQEVRYAAAQGLAKIEGLRALPYLVRAILASQREVRDVAKLALADFDWAQLDPAGAVVSLILDAIQQGDARQRATAVEILAKSGKHDYIKHFEMALENADFEGQRRAVHALNLLEWQPKNDIQRARVAVASREWEKAVRLGAVATEPLIFALKNDDRIYLEEIKQSLVNLGQVSIEPLSDLLNRSGDQHLRQAIISVLGELGGSEAANALSSILSGRERDKTLEIEAIRALCKIGDKAVFPLAQALDHTSPAVSDAATSALLDIGVPAVAPLIVMLKDKFSRSDASRRENLRFKAASVLSRLNWQPSNDEERVYLAIALKRYSKAASLGVIAIRPLLDAYSWSDLNRDQRNLMEIEYALLQIQDNRAIQPLMKASQHLHNTRLREVSEKILLNIGASSLEALTELLNNVDSDIRRMAAAALGHLRDDRAVEPLIASLKNRERPIERESVAWAIAQCGGSVSLQKEIMDTVRFGADLIHRMGQAVQQTPDQIKELVSFLRAARVYLFYSDIYTSSRLTRYADDGSEIIETTYSERGFCLSGQPERGRLPINDEETIWLLTSGRLLEIKKTPLVHSDSRFHGRYSDYDWSSKQSLLNLQTFLSSASNCRQAVRNCCSDLLTILAYFYSKDELNAIADQVKR